MRHVFAVTPEQLEALRRPWGNAEALAGLALMEGIRRSNRPIRVECLGRLGRQHGEVWAIEQSIATGGHRLVLFRDDGEVALVRAEKTQANVRQWLSRNTRRVDLGARTEDQCA